MIFLHLAFMLLGLAVTANAVNTKLTEVYAWKHLDYNFPNDSARQKAIDSGEYVIDNNLPLGLAVWKDKLFVTVPRWKSGIASTLNYISLSDKSLSPKLTPYPSWEANKLPCNESETDSDSLISVFRVAADECDRLWVIDTGLADILGDAHQYRQPTIYIYDLKTDTLIKKYTLKSEEIKANSFFANIVPDVSPNDCNNAFAYIPDLGAYGIIVYDLQNNDSWRIEHHYFHFDPLAGNYDIAGVNFQWTDGVFGISLSEINETDNSRKVYFHPLSSTNEFEVCNKILQNKTASSDNYHHYKLLGSKGPNSQSTASYLDTKSGVLFYTQISRNGVGCWNSKKAFTLENQALVTSDDDTFVFPNDLKVDFDGNLWVLTDRMPLFIYRKLDFDEINYRIFKSSVQSAIEGTVCANE